jgi:hypothetical protein
LADPEMPSGMALADNFGCCDVPPTNAHFPVMKTCVAAIGEQLLSIKRLLIIFMVVKEQN